MFLFFIGFISGVIGLFFFFILLWILDDFYFTNFSSTSIFSLFKSHL